MRISCRPTFIIGVMFGLLVATAVPAASQPASESAEAQLFIDGFNAYQDHDDGLAVEKLYRVLREYPASTLRDMSLYWLARALYRSGDRPEAARCMARFLKEYPDHPLKGTVEAELLALAADYSRGTVISRLPAAGLPQKPAAAVRKAKEQPAPQTSDTSERHPVTPQHRTAQVVPAGEHTAAQDGPVSSAPAGAPPPSHDGPAIQTITVKRGDTLTKLAKRYGTTVSQILRLNRIDNPDIILIGGTLRIRVSPQPRQLSPAPARETGP